MAASSAAVMPLLEISGSHIPDDFDQRSMPLQPDVTYAIIRRDPREAPINEPTDEQGRHYIRLPEQYKMVSTKPANPRLEMTLRVDAGGVRRVTVASKKGTHRISGGIGGAGASSSQQGVAVAQGDEHIFGEDSTITTTMKNKDAIQTLSITVRFGTSSAIHPRQLLGVLNERKRPRSPSPPLNGNGGGGGGGHTTGEARDDLDRLAESYLPPEDWAANSQEEAELCAAIAASTAE